MWCNGIPSIIYGYHENLILEDCKLKIYLPLGETEQKLHVGDNLKCKVELKFDDINDYLNEEFYILPLIYKFCCPVVNTEKVAIELHYHSKSTEKYAFLLRLNDSKNKFIADFGDGKHDYHLQFLEENIFLFGFTLTKKSMFQVDKDKMVLVRNKELLDINFKESEGYWSNRFMLKVKNK